MTPRAPADVSARLDAVVARRALLDHPFYRAWMAGTLDVADLRLYAAQYWHQVVGFPRYLEALIPLAPLGIRSILAENLHDEIEGRHAELWRRFALSLGEDELDAAPVWPETRTCVESFEQAVEHGPFTFALGMIYGYESQTAGVAMAKIGPLRDAYGLTPDSAECFSLHAILDVEHAYELARAITAIAGDDEGSIQTAEAGAWAGVCAISTLLDGVWARSGLSPGSVSSN